jgi:hypothetical protein
LEAEKPAALSAGLCLWVVYGVAIDDWVIVLANSIGATLALAVLGFKIRDLNSCSRSLGRIAGSGVQPEKACDKEDDDDDADDVENVHGVLRLRHARFQHESAALQQERPGLQVCSTGHGSRRWQRWSILYRLAGLISYNGKIEIHNSLLGDVLHDKPEIKRDETTGKE